MAQDLEASLYHSIPSRTAVNPTFLFCGKGLVSRLNTKLAFALRSI
jgi:hypothetical protein